MIENFADIEGPVRIGYLFYILLGTGLVAAAVLAILVIRKLSSRKEAKNEVVDPGPRPIEVALQRLDKLRGEEHLEADPFTVEVSDIVRFYLEGALHLPAREQTTEEFLIQMEGREDLPDAIPQQMPPFLEACDRVKFARQALQAGEREHLLDTASTVITTTEASLQSIQSPTSDIASS